MVDKWLEWETRTICRRNDGRSPEMADRGRRTVGRIEVRKMLWIIKNMGEVAE